MNPIARPRARFRTQFDDYADRVSPAIECHEATRTDISQFEATDINLILERFRVTGRMDTPIHAPTYGDFTGIADFQSARRAILQAEDSFMRLPADFRAKLGNDPQQFLEYIQDPDNRQDLEKRGYVLPASKSTEDPNPKAAAAASIAPAGAEQK